MSEMPTNINQDNNTPHASNANNTSLASCVMSNWDMASANDWSPSDRGEPGITFGVVVGVGTGVDVVSDGGRRGGWLGRLA